MQRRSFVLGAAAIVLSATCGLYAAPAQAQWKPDRPITIIVPWPAGGSTDQVTRLAAVEIEKALNQKVVIVNQPGASGSIGTKNALEAAKDGHTWTAGAAKDLGTYIVSGLLDTKIGDWRLYLSVINVSVLGVNPSAPYKNPADLIAAMKAKPGSVSVATAGVNSSGHAAMESFARALGITYKHVTYDGGRPAVIAVVSGESEVTTQLAVEQADMIRAKRLVPLAVLSDKSLELSGYGTIAPITKDVPSYRPDANYFGIFVPKSLPGPVLAALDKIWTDVIPKSEAMKKYATANGAVFAPVFGDAALAAAMPAIRSTAWQLHDAGKSKVAPDKVGIARP